MDEAKPTGLMLRLGRQGAFAHQRVLRHNRGMPAPLSSMTGVAAARLDDSAKTRALMDWLDPGRHSTYLDGVDQGVVRSGADVVRGLALAPDLARAVAAGVDEWLLFGRLGTLEVPDGVPADIARLVIRRSALIRPDRGAPALVRPMPEATPVGPSGLLSKSGGNSPPQGVRDACRRGLELAPEYGGPGLTEGAKQRARSMAAGEAVSSEQAAKMSAWFARHDKNYTRQSSPPSPGYVAFLLWGGDAGRSWSRRVSDSSGDEAAKAHGVRGVHSGKYLALRATEKAADKTPKWKKQGLVGPGGAWATAKREAKKRGKNEAYAAKLYSKFTGKN